MEVEVMIERICQIDRELDDSVFLFGARQTGKSTFLRQKYPDSIYIDLLDTTLRGRFKRRPALLYEMLSDKENGTLVISRPYLGRLSFILFSILRR